MGTGIPFWVHNDFHKLGVHNTFYKLSAEIQRIHDTLSASFKHDDLQRAATALTSRELSLEMWQDWWSSSALSCSHVIDKKRGMYKWAKQGYNDIQPLLEEIAHTVKLLKDADFKPHDTQTFLQPIWRLITFGWFETTPTSKAISLYTLELALQLSQTLERLWFTSMVWNDVLEEDKFISCTSPSSKQQVSPSILHRQGAIALYQACQRSTSQFEFDVELLRHSSMPAGGRMKLLFHIFVPSADDPSAIVSDITAEPIRITQTEVAAKLSRQVVIHTNPDLAAFKSDSPSGSHVIGIQPSYSWENCYFRTATTHATSGFISEEPRSVLGSMSGWIFQKTATLQPLTWKAKVDLAYDLVQCGLYLLGTPWLAFLSSKHLRKIETKDRSMWVLRVETMPLEILYHEHRDALREKSQMIQIGMLLVKIALDGLDTSDPAEIEDPCPYAIRKLPLVHNTVGVEYYRACVFCLGVDSLEMHCLLIQTKKYEYSLWETTLSDVLGQYHTHVVSRLQGLRDGLQPPLPPSCRQYFRPLRERRLALMGSGTTGE